jgi:hypothetical protein
LWVCFACRFLSTICPAPPPAPSRSVRHDTPSRISRRAVPCTWLSRLLEHTVRLRRGLCTSTLGVCDCSDPHRRHVTSRRGKRDHLRKPPCSLTTTSNLVDETRSQLLGIRGASNRTLSHGIDSESAHIARSCKIFSRFVKPFRCQRAHHGRLLHLDSPRHPSLQYRATQSLMLP